MKTTDLLFEIGSEEIPSGYLSDAIKSLSQTLVSSFEKARLHSTDIRCFSTPRRLAVLVSGLETRQADATFERTGPAKRAALNADNQPTPALLGFLKSCAATLDDVTFETTPKGEYAVVRKPLPGQDTIALLPDILTGLIAGLAFPKSMHWKDADFTFARPLRWLVALFGDDVVPLTFHGIPAGRVSRGNRFQKIENPVTITAPADYEQCLAQVAVLADRETRKTRIREQLTQLFPSGDAMVIPDEGLLDTVVDLVEYPTAVIADFDPKYLQLPEKVITSTLSANQRVFAVQDRDGKLKNQFVFISNGNPEYSDTIRRGNEKVVRPRLEDAVFFYNEDLKTPLANNIARLEEVTFQAKLGSLREKTDRITALAESMAVDLGLTPEAHQNVIRASRLCKTDLITNMIGEKEFTKLQGYIGKEYALAQGEVPDVAEAIFEHYLPRGQNDRLPVTVTGRLVALADKMDTVCGIIGVGMIPTGSADPFALRRAANGIVQILDDGNLELNLLELVDRALTELAPRLENVPETTKWLRDFFRQRVAWLLKEKQIDYDVVDSVMHIDYSNIPDLVRRANALQGFKQRPDFIRLVLGFKRVSNIIAEAKNVPATVDPNRFEHASERLLAEGADKLAERIDILLAQHDYPSVLEELVHFSTTIDNFFNDVLVNAENEAVRMNRYALLQRIRALFLRVADIAKIVADNSAIE